MQKSLTFRLRGKGETLKDVEKRKKGIEKSAKNYKCSEAEIIRAAIDFYLLQSSK